MDAVHEGRIDSVMQRSRNPEPIRPGFVRVECAGGCGKLQVVRERHIRAEFTHIGCGVCVGWKELQSKYLPAQEGTVLEIAFNVAGGFQGMRLRIADIAERESRNRAKGMLALAVEEVAKR